MLDYNKILSSTGSEFSEENLSEYTSYLLKKAPEDYQQFIRECNGGYPAPEHCFIEPEHAISGVNICVVEFFSFSSQNAHLDIANALDVYDGRLPDDLLPIASDDFGNLILLGSFRGREAVYFWDHENEYLENHGNVEFLADSFTEFISLLKEEPSY